MKPVSQHKTGAPTIQMAKKLSAFFAVAWILVCLAGVHADDFSDELPRIPPTEAADTLKHFDVAEGFQIQLVASEPLVNSPVAIEWDAMGRMFVCEMRGYSEDRDDELSRISLLVDEDHDGVYESGTVYTDRLLWPTAIFPYDGGLFVADAPDIYYFKDTDGDGRADTKKTVFTGFKTSNVQGLLNSFRWGLDNRIHIACGTVGGKIRRQDADQSSAIEARGHDLAFDPKTFLFALTSGGAQHGMCFDDWGRKFVSSNSDHLQQVMYEDRYIARNRFFTVPPARLSIAADGPQAEVFRVSPVEPWRIVRTRLRVAGLVRGPVEGGGRAAGYFTGATGVTIYRGDAWPDQLKGLAIIGDVGSNLVHRKRLSPNGVPRIGHRIDEGREFVASRDIWFRPAQYACGPDGALSIVDVCREVIEHPASLPPDIKKHLDLTAGRDRGRIYRVVPENYQHRPAPHLAKMSTQELVFLLNHKNAWHRETAARLIYQRHDRSVADILRQQARQGETSLGRLHSMYALHGLGELDTTTLIDCLADTEPHVVRHAIRLAETQSADGLITALQPLIKHPSIEVRYQLAFTLGELEFADRTKWLAQILTQDPNDLWIQAAVGSSIGNDASVLFSELLQGDSSDAVSFLQRLAVQINRENDAKQIRLAMEAAMNAPDHPMLLPVIGRLIANRGSSTAVFKNFEKTFQEKIDRRIDELTRIAAAGAEDESKSDSERQRNVAWMVDGNESIALPVLKKVLDSTDSSTVQMAAIRTLGQFRSPRICDPLIEGWPSWSPRLRSAALDVLFSSTPRSQQTLIAVDDERLSADEIPLSRWKTLAGHKDPKIANRAKSYLSSVSDRSRDSVIQQYRVALTLSGDRTKGAVVFQKQCAGCHKVGDRGHEIGPSLAAATTRGAESILTNVLDPNREVNPQYINYAVLTDNGQTHSGMIVSENSNSIVLKRAESVTQTILRDEIEQIRGTGQSIMPEGMEKEISPQDMADLIAFLLQKPTGSVPRAK